MNKSIWIKKNILFFYCYCIFLNYSCFDFPYMYVLNYSRVSHKLQHCLWATKDATLCKSMLSKDQYFSAVQVILSALIQVFSTVQVILSALIQDFSTVQVFSSALIQSSALCKNFQDLLVISARLRSAMFESALCEALVIIFLKCPRRYNGQTVLARFE